MHRASRKGRRFRTQRQGSVAIVGMAVDFLGAHKGFELWRLLDDGIDTVEEVRPKVHHRNYY